MAGEITRHARSECVICAATGSILLKSDAVKVGGKYYRPECAPGAEERAAAVPPITRPVEPVEPTARPAEVAPSSAATGKASS